jgi:hypothetical protein
LIFFCAAFAPLPAAAQDAGALRARHAALREQLAHNPFGRPLHVESTAAGGAHEGEIYAVLEHPYGTVAPALARPAQWCEILTLQVNVKRCSAANEEALTAFITRKARDSADGAHRAEFRFDHAAARADYVRVALSAAAGPVGTRDYRLVLEAVPLDSRRTFMHLSYAYTLGAIGRLAMDAYLAGAGREKLGFSVVERLPDRRAVYVDGERGVVERSAMRYYLAIEAYLGSLAVQPGKRLEARLRDWYAATTRYPQLREQVGADEYVRMKLNESRAALRPVDPLGDGGELASLGHPIEILVHHRAPPSTISCQCFFHLSCSSRTTAGSTNLSGSFCARSSTRRLAGT